MVRLVSMLLLAVAVAVSMTVILVRFLRRLRRIEEDLWGPRKKASRGPLSRFGRSRGASGA